jgi:hypothetical protein
MDDTQKVYPIFTNLPIEPIRRSPRIKFDFMGLSETKILIGDLTKDYQCIIDVMVMSGSNEGFAGKALIDTGSFYSFITRPVANACGLTIDGEQKAQTFGTKIKTFKSTQGMLKIPSINNFYGFPINLLLNEEKDLFKGIIIILGTDCISNFLFKYNDPRGKFSLEYIKSDN